jgi:hypothetical protein
MKKLYIIDKEKGALAHHRRIKRECADETVNIEPRLIFRLVDFQIVFFVCNKGMNIGEND